VSVSEKELIERALDARKRAYAPYSKYDVGAALLAGGQVYTGANVESGAYWGGICAERTAMLSAVLAGQRKIDLVAVATHSSPPASPCGVCRQMMSEFAHDPIKLRIISVNLKGERRDFTLGELFPFAYEHMLPPE
jgi:cytidine deaminase